MVASGLRSVPWYQSHTARDIVVYGLLLVLGALQFYMSRRADDFYAGDVTYFELARSIIEKGFYGFNLKSETTLPPGFPVILASLCVTVGCSYAVLVRSMVIFATLGFMVSYKLLRILGERQVVAAGVCLLLASSPIIFAFSTSLVFSDLPYFFTSALALLLAVRLDTAKSLRVRAMLWLLCGFLLVGSLLIRSAGIALLIGLFAWLVATWFVDRKSASQRLKTFLPLLLVGIVVQGLWMQWVAKHEVVEWPMVEGYPKSYVAQLRVKNGNYPELGTASLGDIPSRVAQNLSDEAVVLTQLLTRKEFINPAWFSPLVFGSILFTVVGVAFSIWRRGGGFPEWYFVSYEAMYLLWPWNFSVRFFLPIAPLTCLYIWRGGRAVVNLATKRPRTVGSFSFPLSVPLAVYAGVAGWHSGGLQLGVSAIFWTLVATVSAWMTWTGSYRPPEAFALFLSRLETLVSLKEKSLTFPRIVGAVTVAVLVVVGLVGQVAVGRDNLAVDVTRYSTYADVLAGQWVAANTASDAVVMARHLDLVYHYSRRKVVWFPPSSDPELLIEGIRKHKVEFIIVSERQYNYWLPPESICFGSVLRTYRRDFQLVHEEPRFKIFRFVPEFSDVGSLPGRRRK